MIRTALAFVLGLSIGLLFADRLPFGASDVITSEAHCQISVHLRSDPPGVFNC